MNNKLNPEILERELQIDEQELSCQILDQHWYFGVCTTLKKGILDLFRERNKEKYDCRFAPKGQYVCYLARDVIELENETGNPDVIRTVYFINRNVKIIDLNLGGAINRVNRIKELCKDIEKLVEEERSEAIYKASCYFAKKVIEAGFDGIYYSRHPRDKHLSSIKNKFKGMYPNFDLDNAYGATKRLVIFKNAKEVISFAKDKYQDQIMFEN